MSEAQHLSATVEGLFSKPDHGWFTPFTVAVASLTADQAAGVPAPGFTSVWALVNHVNFWQESVLLRLRGLPVSCAELGAENDWPPPGDPADERAWRQARERAVALNKELCMRG